MADKAIVYQNTRDENPYENSQQSAGSSGTGNIRFATINDVETSRQHENTSNQPETLQPTSVERSTFKRKKQNLQTIYNIVIAAAVLAAIILCIIVLTNGDKQDRLVSGAVQTIGKRTELLMTENENMKQYILELEGKITSSNEIILNEIAANGNKTELLLMENENMKQSIMELEEKISSNEELIKRALQSSCYGVIPRFQGDTGGVYTIFPFSGGKSGIEVYCDLVTDDGRWIVFQKRMDGSENFARNWSDYVNGFGRLDGEFWLGLEKLHRLTAGGDYEMRIDFEDFEGTKNYAEYGSFQISAADDYSITVSGYTGDAGDGLAPVNGAKFSTVDKDQDNHGQNCAELFTGGWWFESCHHGNLNGLYLRGEHETYANGVGWRPLLGYYYSLKRAEMKIRKRK